MSPPFRWSMTGCSGGQALGGPQAGAPGARVGGELGWRRGQRRAGHEPETGIPAADADRQLGRADAAPPLGGDEALDDPVLERVVAEDDEPAARPQEGARGGERVLECLELLGDRDPERLEDAGRGVDPATDPRVAGGDALDERRQGLGGGDRLGLPLGDDRPGGPRRLLLLAIAPEERGELGGVECREQLRGGHAARGVEAHVERAAGPEAEAPLAVRQLEAREPEVEEHPVDGAEAGLRGDRRELPEVRLAQDESIPESGLEATGDSGDGRPIGVEAEEAATRRGRLQDPLGVPTAADRGIALQAVRRRREHRHDLLHQHRRVPFLHQSSTIRTSDPERTPEAHVVGPPASAAGPLAQMPRPSMASASAAGSSRLRRYDSQRSGAQISAGSRVPTTTASPARPAMSRRKPGMRTRPCPSSVVSTAPAKMNRSNRRARSSAMGSVATLSASASQLARVWIARQFSSQRDTTSTASSWARNRDGTASRPLSSTECRYSPVNT